MARNVEIKAVIPTGKFDSILEKTKSLATEGPFELSQTDTFFSTPRGRLKTREFGDGTAELIFYERPDCEGPKTSSYIRSECQPSVREALESAYGVTGVVKKKRTLYLIDHTRVHIDVVEGLGQYLELEVVLTDDQSDEFGQLIADELLQKLEIASADLVSGAYVDLLSQVNS